jgi:hypothetical protein
LDNITIDRFGRSMIADAGPGLELLLDEPWKLAKQPSEGLDAEVQNLLVVVNDDAESES